MSKAEVQMKTSAGVPKAPRAIVNLRNALKDYIPDSIDLLGKALNGGLVRTEEVWKGKTADMQAEMDADPSVSFETTTLPNGKVIPVLVRWIPVSKDKVDTAKWLINKDSELKKVAEDSRLKKLAIQQKEKELEKTRTPEEIADELREKAKNGDHIKPANSLDLPDVWEEDEDDG